MLEKALDAGLAHKPGQRPLLVAQSLDGDVATHAAIARSEHFTHTALAQRFAELVPGPNQPPRLSSGVQWVRCERPSCDVFSATDLHGGRTRIGAVPHGTVMGVFARANYRQLAVVSYPMLDRGGAVQVIEWFTGAWADAGSRPHAPPPTQDLARRWRWCAGSSCTVNYTADLDVIPELLRTVGSVPRCTQMGVFLSDSRSNLDVVSYPMWDRLGAVQVVPRSSPDWVTYRPSGC
jgi:hypothetical protein